MASVYIALGSNLDNPLAQLEQAVKSLQQFATDFALSPIYGSKPLGPQDQPDYVNAVARFSTPLSPLELLDCLQQIENSQGRVRLRRWGERTLDLDILLYDDQQIHSERLTIPHYDMQRREFVIVPLYDLNPDLILPDGTAIGTLYRQFQDHQMVRYT
ncbi:7,8-dihydro-6-hydroxymethylpterin-pyrophosphokinase [Pasteurellaceae bacterium Macca]|nr:7,8-dihydro-6-hydroxymethylpterin-pyrophosphokinase [Pasteurellaceae bacterium Macca]